MAPLSNQQPQERLSKLEDEMPHPNVKQQRRQRRHRNSSESLRLSRYDCRDKDDKFRKDDQENAASNVAAIALCVTHRGHDSDSIAPTTTLSNHSQEMTSPPPPTTSTRRSDCSDNFAEDDQMLRTHHNQPPNQSSRHNTDAKSVIRNQKQLVANIPRKLLSIFIISTIFNHLNQLNIKTFNATTADAGSNDNHLILHLFKLLPNIVHVGAVECSGHSDCLDPDKICHENKCICNREKPVEDRERSMCLPLAAINDLCSMNEQCMSSSICIDGVCSCGPDAIGLLNPSNKLYYCHPKRQLNQECYLDPQCPENSFCSVNKCLCQNGYGPATFVNDGIESKRCLPKICSIASDCESEFHLCEDNKCKCLATHFDPHTALCYKFGSTGGKPAEDSDGANSTHGNITNLFDNENDDSSLYSIIKDLTKNSDRMWLVILILVVLTILLFTLIFFLIRRHYLGYCWTGHKKEYEPNNKSSPRNGYFNKNSINNKSFRQKNGETEEDGDDTAADRSNLVTKTSVDKANKNISCGSLSQRAAFVTSNNDDADGDDNQKHLFVKVDMNENKRLANSSDPSNGRQYEPFIHRVVSPLASSTSTPV